MCKLCTFLTLQNLRFFNGTANQLFKLVDISLIYVYINQIGDISVL